MRKDAQAVLLLLVGTTLIKISLTGSYVRYVKAGHLLLLLAGGAALVTIAVVNLWLELRGPVGRHTAGAATRRAAHSAALLEPGGPEPSEQAGADAELDAHAHAHPRVAWLLLAPVLAVLLVAPPSVGAFQASRNGTALSAPAGSDFAPLPDQDPVRLSVLDYASRAAYDDGRSLLNRHVVLSGFVIAGPGGQPYLARMIATCCAADARPVKLGMAGDVPATLNPDEWIEIVGLYVDRIDRDPVNGGPIPYVQVVSLRDIDPPGQQYES